MNKALGIIGGIVVVLAIIFAYIYWWTPDDVDNIPNNGNPTTTDDGINGDSVDDNDDVDDNEQQISVTVNNVSAGDTLTSPAVITGEARGWYFEASFLVELVDEDGNVIIQAQAEAQGDWMTTSSVPFQAVLTFDVSAITNAKIVLKKANPSGLAENAEEVHIPVILEPVDEETMTLLVYFSSTNKDPNMLNCSHVYPVKRTVSSTQAVARAVLMELFDGPTSAEAEMGYSSSIPDGAEINSLTVENGVAKVDFSADVEPAGGSCAVTAAVAQIRQTLMQFPTVNSVDISVEGRSEYIFQP